MLGISYMEMLIIALITLVVVGPEHLPDIAKQIGKIMRAINLATWDLNHQLQLTARQAITSDGKPTPKQPEPSAPVEEPKHD